MVSGQGIAAALDGKFCVHCVGDAPQVLEISVWQQRAKDFNDVWVEKVATFVAGFDLVVGFQEKGVVFDRGVYFYDFFVNSPKILEFFVWIQVDKFSDNGFKSHRPGAIAVFAVQRDDFAGVIGGKVLDVDVHTGIIV